MIAKTAEPKAEQHSSRTIRWAALFIFLAAIAFGAVYIHRWASAVDAEHARIRAQGEPLTDADFRALVPPIKEGEDCFDLLQQAAKRISDDPNFRSGGKFEKVPVIGLADYQDFPSMDKPWPEPELTSQFLADHSETIRLLHAISKRGGRANLPRYMPENPFATSTDEYQVRNLTRLLILNALWNCRNDNKVSAKESLLTALKLSNVLADSPSDQLLRYAVVTMAVDVHCRLAFSLRYTSAELTQFAKALDEIDVKHSLQLDLMGQRAQWDQFFENPATSIAELNKDDSALQFDRIPGGNWLLRKKSSPARMAHLQLMREFIDVAGDEWPLIFGKSQENPPNLGKTPSLEIVYTSLSHPVLQTTLITFTGIEARIQCARAIIAIERASLGRENIASDLKSLVPEFLTNVPMDPFTGEPMHVASDRGSVCVYSDGPSPDVANSKLRDPLTSPLNYGFRIKLRDPPVCKITKPDLPPERRGLR